MMRLRHSFVLVLLAAALVAPVGFAQTVGTIVGVLQDTSGGSLPGVSVEGKSPVLRGTRRVVTSANAALRTPLRPPGDSTVVFSLSGFNKVETRPAVQPAS